MYDAICYDLQMRYALEYRSLGEGHFELRTMYNFRQRLAKHMQETGENLIGEVFADATGKQVQALAVKTGKLRMSIIVIRIAMRSFSRTLLEMLLDLFQLSLYPLGRESWASLLGCDDREDTSSLFKSIQFSLLASGAF